MEPRIATGLDYLALELESHVKYYTPRCWREPINSAAFSPSFSGEELSTFIDAYLHGDLHGTIERLAETGKYPYNQLKPFYIKEAIEDYFEKVFKEKHSGKKIEDIGKSLR